jgi:hypothetical protein
MQRDVICLLSEAHSTYPDSRAAGNLLKKLSVMLPDIKIDPAYAKPQQQTSHPMPQGFLACQHFDQVPHQQYR